MEEHIVKILEIQQVTHDVKSFKIEKPEGYHFKPGQATEVSVNEKDWKGEKRPFTFTSLNTDSFLQFTIKRYENHHGVTDKLHQLKTGDTIIIRDVWGAIEYKGPGYFIAGGAGITPFISILRQLNQTNALQGNTLFFSNKTDADIIYKDELKKMLGDNAVFIITKEKNSKYKTGYINKDFIKENVNDFKKHFYVCGPDEMVKAITDTLSNLGASTDAVVFEK